MIHVVCAIIIRKNKILITRLGPDSDHPLKWEFPGGKIWKNEKPEMAIKREIYEELLCTIEPIIILKEISYDYGFKKILLYPFICRIIKGNPKLMEHIELKWIDFEKLYKMDLSEADRRMIESEINKKYLLKYLRENMKESS